LAFVLLFLVLPLSWAPGLRLRASGVDQKQVKSCFAFDGMGRSIDLMSSEYDPVTVPDKTFVQETKKNVNIHTSTDEDTWTEKHIDI
jgi:hypothetical protein